MSGQAEVLFLLHGSLHFPGAVHSVKEDDLPHRWLPAGLPKQDLKVWLLLKSTVHCPCSLIVDKAID